jgi:predicted PurR-regulated permease PerM
MDSTDPRGPAVDRRIYLALLLFAATGLTIWAFGLILSPFLVPIGWAMCLATVTGGLFKRLERWTKKPRFAAFVMTLGTALAVVQPLVVFGSLVVEQALTLSRGPMKAAAALGGASAAPTAGLPGGGPSTVHGAPAAPGGAPAPAPAGMGEPAPAGDGMDSGMAPADGMAAEGPTAGPAPATPPVHVDAWDDFFARNPRLARLLSDIDHHLKPLDKNVRSMKDEALKLLGQPFATGALGVLNGLLSISFGFIVMLAVLYVLYRDGARMRKLVTDLVPMDPGQTLRVLDVLRRTAYAAIVGGLATALIQGALGGSALAITGVKAPVLWGFVMAVLSLLPIGGSAFVWAPTAIYFLATGEPVKGWFLLVWGVFVIGMADNFLRPALMRKAGAGEIHPLLLFLAILSGIGLFG